MVREIPTAIAHLALAASAFFTLQNLSGNIQYGYAAFITWMVWGALGAIKYAYEDIPPEKVTKYYTDIVYVHGFLDMPSILTDLYLSNGFSLPVSATQAGSGLLIALIYFMKHDDTARKYKDFFIPAYLASGAGLMVFNENWFGLIPMGVYGLTEFTIGGQLDTDEKFIFVRDGWRAIGLAIFSFMLPEIF